MNTGSRKKIEYYNKKAGFDYFLEDEVEAGIVLSGLEIKAIRSGRVNLTGSHVKVLNNEVFWLGGIINVKEGDPQRTRKLLLNKNQIKRLIGSTAEKGFSVIPLKIYLKHGKAKLLIALGKGKKKYDKRETIKQRDYERREQRMT